MSNSPAPETAAELSVIDSHRIEMLRSYGVLDAIPEASFDDITLVAASVCQTPVALVSLVDNDRQWFMSERGLGRRETPLSQSFCAHTILQEDVLVVPDTRLDARFVDNPLVTGNPPLCFYAGATLRSPDGVALGALCVLDHRPRQLRPHQLDSLRALARQVVSQLELRRTLTLARASGDYRGRIMAIAGHDLHTPLRTAVYALEKLRRGDAEEPARLMQLAQDALIEIGNDFDDLAALSGNDEVTALPTTIDLPLEDILHPVLLRWRRQARMKGLRLRAVPSSLIVHSHRALLSALVGNLVGNAVKYTHAGSVLVGARRRNGQAVITVADTGIGMDETQAAQMFGAFQQVDARSEGLGLGLWIVRRTADTLGYTVQVRSRPGHGSCFTVTVPLAKTPGTG
ncbi:GAF domain-containing sensor histidine kinase [Dyella sp.]|jgi:signal transduction histidine kinase|uniref:sensor histidine kinase n=1 Tax=Dyella sp. TaxID=1869338 RepID=UPI002D79DFD7|nr:GAF domain-containing sensor histidine kinase [Dyella sp.]HET6431041.1 GAF domain-containing sensor histidine kinase [Dyella sp.]